VRTKKNRLASLVNWRAYCGEMANLPSAAGELAGEGEGAPSSALGVSQGPPKPRNPVGHKALCLRVFA